MNEIRSTPLALMVVAWLAALGIPGGGAPGAMARETQVGGDAAVPEDFQAKGAHTHERIVSNAKGDLGYVVQMEHIRFHVPGQEKESTRDYRVTMVFRREADGWRILHRQADAQTVKQAPQ